MLSLLEPQDRVNGARAGSWTLPGKGDFLYEPINFGVVRRYMGKGGSGAISAALQQVQRRVAVRRRIRAAVIVLGLGCVCLMWSRI